tara:strand:+ start:1846 stop:2907 length:1062 start_codon:yes stop_codon:yes gene_type:complete
MPTYYYAINSKKEILINTVPHDLIDILTNTSNKPSPIKIKSEQIVGDCRIGNKSNQHGTVYIITNDSVYLKSFKKFKELVRMSTIALNSINLLKEKIIENQISITQELIHNLTSLNGYGIQDAFSLVPQELLTANIYSQHTTVKEIFTEKPNVAASTFLQIIKYNLAMKVEFSVFEKTMEKYPTVQKIEYPIRKVILSAIQIFISDFDAKNIEIHIASSSKLISLDNDIFFVSLYYLLDNAVKYSARGTTLKIFFNERERDFAVEFNTISIRIEENEKNKICDKGYRSKNAEAIDTLGKGIGMFRILKTLKLNNAKLEIIPRASEYHIKIKNNLYEHNQFIITFPGQQNWFKL